MTADTVFELILLALVAKKLYDVARDWCVQDTEPLTPFPKGGLSPEDLERPPGEEVPVRNIVQLQDVSARAHFWHALKEVVDELVQRELGFLVERPGELHSDVLYVRGIAEATLQVEVCVRSQGFVTIVPRSVYDWLPPGLSLKDHPSATIWHIERWVEEDFRPWLSFIASEVLYPTTESRAEPTGPWMRKTVE